MAKIKDYIKCEKCGSISYYDSYFKLYTCNSCGWQGKESIESYIEEVIEDTGVTKQELLQLIDNVLKISYLSGNYDNSELKEMKDYLEREVMSSGDKEE